MRTVPLKQKPKLGQNFLTDTRAQQQIVDALGDTSAGTVVEIGPGRAALNELLARQARRLVAIEIDRSLAAGLRFRFREQPSVEILEADVLKVDLSTLAESGAEGERSLSVLGNLPYYITSPILQHLFAHERVVRRAVVMVQLEVAERMAAQPGSRDYGLLSVLCRMHAQTELLFDLPPEAFSPPPKVHSAVVRIEFAPHQPDLAVDPGAFRRFLNAAFAHKRKTIVNNLRAAGYQSPALSDALAACRLKPAVRAEEMSVEQLAGLLNTLQASKGSMPMR
jgi:16S rRNA (adenine1518-N6/adenine1519-N6)-dimethyltransferase